MRFRNLVSRWLPEGGVARKIATVSGGVLIGHLVTVIFTPLLTRLYNPEAFGSLGVFMAILGVVGSVAPLYYERAIPIVRQDSVARSLLIVSLGAVTSTTTLALMAILILKAVDCKVLIGINANTWLIPLGVMAHGTNQTLVAWGLRQRKYGPIARAKAAQAACTAVLQGTLGLARVGFGLVFGDVLGRVLGCGLLIRNARVGLSLGPQSRNPRRYLFIAKAYSRFPLFGVGSVLLNTLALNGPTLLAAAMLGPTDTGIFVFATRIVSIPSALVGQAASQVYLGEMSVIARERPTVFRAHFRAAVRKLAIASAFPSFLLACLAPFLTAPIFGAPWRLAGKLMAILAPMMWASLVASPVSSSLILLGRQDLQLAWDVGRTLLLTVALGGIMFFGHGLITFTSIYSIGMIVAYLGMIWLIDGACHAQMGRRVKD